MKIFKCTLSRRRCPDPCFGLKSDELINKLIISANYRQAGSILGVTTRPGPRSVCSDVVSGTKRSKIAESVGEERNRRELYRYFPDVPARLIPGEPDYKPSQLCAGHEYFRKRFSMWD
ncbi:hypothetical protein EVAR_16223_1 [Eumeta japonica]|uniref:Uncharacterized protein n=1 Tax=Eumeta variegata TaxID=151549 RepID=A0A4C1U772_EUMVA|nr:hypothetical protein EVAR_16223_1 [Eumeta japonica]